MKLVRLVKTVSLAFTAYRAYRNIANGSRKTLRRGLKNAARRV